MDVKNTMMLLIAATGMMAGLSACQHDRSTADLPQTNATQPVAPIKPIAKSNSTSSPTQENASTESVSTKVETDHTASLTKSSQSTPPEPPRQADSPQPPATTPQSADTGDKYANGVDPKQTSTDPTYGYTKQNPIKVGLPGGEAEGPAAERVYLHHLRDPDFQPMTYTSLGRVSGAPDGHKLDIFEIYSKGTGAYHVYIDMYHPECNPLDQKAPMGLFFSK